MTSRTLLRSAAAVLFVAAVLSLLPAAAAGQPEPLDFNPDELENVATDIGLDRNGLFGASVVQTQTQTGGTNIGGSCGVDAPKTFYVYRMPDETRGGSYCLDDATVESFSQKLAVPTGGAGGAENFAVGGPDGKLLVYNRTPGQSENPVFTHNESGHQPTDVDIAKNGHWIVVGYNEVDSTGGKLLVISVEDGQKSSGPHKVSFSSAPTATEISPNVVGNDAVVAVGTELDGVKFYFQPNLNDAQTFTRSTNAVNDITMSGDGRYAAVGTAADTGGSAGAVYFFGRSSSDGDLDNSYDQYVSRFSGDTTVTETAISADGQYVAAGTDDGRIRFLENRFPNDPDRHSARVGDTWSHPSGNPPVQDIDVSDDGRYFVAAVGGTMWGFTQDTGEVLWAVAVPEGGIEHVDVSGTGDTFIAAANGGGTGHTYGWTHQRGVDVDITPDQPSTKPREKVSVSVNATNTGSTVDTYSFLVTPPSGWGYQPNSVTQELLPGRSANFTLNLTSPEREAPGLYATKIRISSEATGTVVQEAFVNTTIERIHNLNITTKNVSKRVDAGSQALVPFTVDNNGNERSYINVSDIRQSHSTGEAWDVQLEEWEPGEPIPVDRGASKRLTLTIRPPGDANDGDYNRITVILEDDGSSDTFNVTARVNPQFDFEASLTQDKLEMKPDEQRQVELIVRNLGNTLDIIRVNKTITPSDVQNHWKVIIPEEKRNLTLGKGETKSALITIRPDSSDPQPATIRFDLDSRGTPSQRLSLQVQQPPKEDDDTFPVPGPGFAAAVVSAGLAAALRRGFRSAPPGG